MCCLHYGVSFPSIIMCLAEWMQFLLSLKGLLWPPIHIGQKFRQVSSVGPVCLLVIYRACREASVFHTLLALSLKICGTTWSHKYNFYDTVSANCFMGENYQAYYQWLEEFTVLTSQCSPYGNTFRWKPLTLIQVERRSASNHWKVFFPQTTRLHFQIQVVTPSPIM